MWSQEHESATALSAGQCERPGNHSRHFAILVSTPHGQAVHPQLKALASSRYVAPHLPHEHLMRPACSSSAPQLSANATARSPALTVFQAKPMVLVSIVRVINFIISNFPSNPATQCNAGTSLEPLPYPRRWLGRICALY